MKVAVLADIHSNLPALERVADHIEAWHPDRVVMAGDVINRGPRPKECLRFVLARHASAGWQLVRGNHEDYVLYQARPDSPRDGPEFEIVRNAYWTYQKLDERVEPLEMMVFQVTFFSPDDQELRTVHASMRNNRDGIFPYTPDDALRRKILPPPAVLCVGHTHRPLIRQIDQTLVVNVGSVGIPFDGDSRAGYAQLTWHKGRWQAEIVRLEYDRAKAMRDFVDTGFIAEAGPLAEIMFVEFQQSRSLIHLWLMEYESRVLAGEMSVAASVREFLSL
jgi:predicted phosphodiesterase